MLKEAAAVVIAGIAGTIANGVAVALIVAPARIDLLLVPGRYGVAILVAAALPFLFRWLSGGATWISALLVLTVAPSLLAKLVFGAGAPWSLVLGLNAVYAVAAIATYGLATKVATRHASEV